MITFGCHQSPLTTQRWSTIQYPLESIMQCVRTHVASARRVYFDHTQCWNFDFAHQNIVRRNNFSGAPWHCAKRSSLPCMYWQAQGSRWEKKTETHISSSSSVRGSVDTSRPARAMSSRKFCISFLSRVITSFGSTSSLQTASFLIRATRCANLHVDIDSCSSEIIWS